MLDFSERMFAVSRCSQFEKPQKPIRIGRFEFACAVGRARWKSKNDVVSIGFTENRQKKERTFEVEDVPS